MHNVNDMLDLPNIKPNATTQVYGNAAPSEPQRPRAPSMTAPLRPSMTAHLPLSITAPLHLSIPAPLRPSMTAPLRHSILACLVPCVLSAPAPPAPPLAGVGVFWGMAWGFSFALKIS